MTKLIVVGHGYTCKEDNPLPELSLLHTELTVKGCINCLEEKTSLSFFLVLKGRKLNSANY